MTMRLLALSGVVISAALASGCGTESFPVTPTPVATSAVVVQGTKYQGNILLSTGGTTSFNMTLIARELSGATRVTVRAANTPAVTGSFETGSGLKGTVQGTLTGSLDSGFFAGSLTASSAGRTSEQRYSGPITTASAALVPGDCIQGTCAADGLTGAIQTVQTPTANGPPPPSCSYALSPAAASFPGSGGTGSTTVTTSPICAWAAIPTAPWIAIAGAAAGTGVGTVTFTVQANPGEQQRSGSLRVADQILTVVEAAGTTVSGPAITTQPQSQTIATGTAATLSVTATGAAPLSYQWFVGASGTTTTPIAGATASSYTTPALTSTTSYWVRVTNAGGSVDSNTATITVTSAPVTPPVITVHPQSQTIASGATAAMSVTATSTAPLSYQWYVGASGTTTNPIGGATASSYTTPALTSTTTYWVRVTNAGGSVDSNAATITVTPPAVTPPTITTQPQSQTISSGATATLSVTATGTAPLTYQWYVGASGTTTSPISGATASSYTTPALTSTTSYWVRVTNAGGSTNSNTATITVTTPIPPPTITTQPQSQTISSGATATMSVTATGTAPLSYQWYVGASGTTTSPISGATASSYTTPALTSTTSYWVRVTNAGGSTNSNTATITVTTPIPPPTITTQPQSQTISSGATATLSVTATGTAPLTYQWYVGASGTTTSPISGATASSYTTPALTSTTSYWVRVTNAGGSTNSNTATITVTTPIPPPTITAQPQSQTINSGATATLSVTATGTAPLTYQWYVGASGTTTNPISGATGSSYTTPALTATTSYWVRVTNSGGFVNSNTATITVTLSPRITVTPSSAPRPATFTVTGTGFTPGGTADVRVVRNSTGLPEHLIPATVNGAGGFTATFEFLAISQPGTFNVTATDRPTGVASNSVTITLN